MDANTIKPAKPRRRWLRFSLRSLLIVMTALAVLLGYYAWRMDQRERAIAVIEATARNYKGWVLDFDNDRGTVPGGWTTSRNLVLTRPKNNGDLPSGAIWRRQ